MWLFRRGTLRGLVRLRAVAAGGEDAGSASASLLYSSVCTEDPEPLQHNVRHAPGQGMWCSKAFHQPHLQAGMGGWGLPWASTLVPLALSGAATSYYTAPYSTSSSDISTDATSNESSADGSSKHSDHEGRTKVCLNPECGKARKLRHFRPYKSEVDGLSPICDGCKYRFDTYRRLVTRVLSKMSETQWAAPDSSSVP